MRGEYPSDQLWFRLEGYSHKLRGRIAYAKKDWSTALGHFERMREVRDELLSNAPSLVGHQIEVANACVRVGKAARHDGQLDYAIANLERSVRINAHILTEFPGDAEHILRLAYAENDLGAACISRETTSSIANAEAWLKSASERASVIQSMDNLHDMGKRASNLLNVIDKNLIIIDSRRSEATAYP